jgi:hypothetical protein
MQTIVNIIIPKEQLGEEFVEGVSKDSIYAPVTVGGKPIGFISGVTETSIYISLWSYNWALVGNEAGEMLRLEIGGEFSGSADYSFGEEEEGS